MSDYNLADDELSEFWRRFTIDGITPRNVTDYEYLVRKRARRELFTVLHDMCDGNQCKAARALDTTPGHIRKKLEIVGLHWRKLTAPR